MKNSKTSGESCKDATISSSATPPKKPTTISPNRRARPNSDKLSSFHALKRIEASDGRIDFWIAEIAKDVAGTAAWLVQTGTHLAAAKAELGHGAWIKMLRRGNLPFKLRTAEVLMRIAAHGVLSDSRNLAKLPPKLTVLDCLTKADEETVQKGIEDGHILPTTSLKQAKVFVGVVQPRPFDLENQMEKLKLSILDKAVKLPLKYHLRLVETLNDTAAEIKDALPGGAEVLS